MERAESGERRAESESDEILDQAKLIYDENHQKSVCLQAGNWRVTWKNFLEWWCYLDKSLSYTDAYTY